MKKNSNYMRVYQDLRKNILTGIYQHGDQLPTEAQLQITYNVSRITIKKAMEMLSKDDLIQRFPGKGTFVHLHGNAPQVASIHGNTSPVIGVIMSGFSSIFGSQFLRGVAEEVNRQGCTLMAGLCCSSVQEEDTLIERLIQNGVSGIIAMAVHSEAGIHAGIVSNALNGFPMVLVDRYLEGIALPYVGSDHTDAAFQATQYLFSLGHKHIGLISSAPTTTAITERESGYLKSYAMTEYQIHTSYLLPDIRSSMPGQRTQENVYRDVERMKTYFRDNPNVTALLCIDYNIMNICRTAAQEVGLRIPEDLSLVCFDAPDDGFSERNCTHIRQPEQEIGIRSVQMLLEAIKGNRTPEYLLLPAELCIGTSTQPPMR